MTLRGPGFEKYAQTTRRAQYLAEMERVLPWGEHCALIEPVYPKGEGGRPVVEEALYDSATIRALAGIDLGSKPAPDEATMCKIRHLPEKHGLGKKLFAQAGRHLQAKGIKVTNGTIVNATIINAPSSNKNVSGERGPAMHQTKKGMQWYFGMNAHVDMDNRHKLILRLQEA